MEFQQSPLVLTEARVIGEGGHKRVYVHPGDDSLCVKILLHGEEDSDWRKEMRYRRSREKRGLSSQLLTRFFGSQPLADGSIGYIFERVRDYDGQDSRSLREYLDSKESRLKPDMVLAGLLSFRDLLFEEKIITSNMESSNFLIQWLSPSSYRIRIVDNIGSPVTIPLIFYVDFLALRHVKQYWERFVRDLQRRYPQIITEAVAAELR